MSWIGNKKILTSKSRFSVLLSLFWFKKWLPWTTIVYCKLVLSRRLREAISKVERSIAEVHDLRRRNTVLEQRLDAAKGSHKNGEEFGSGFRTCSSKIGHGFSL